MTILLVSGATATLRGLPRDAPVGHLVTPAAQNRIDLIATTGRPWGADNGCGPKRDGSPGVFDLIAFETMLDQIVQACAHAHPAQQANEAAARWPLWVAGPDVVGDWRATRDRWCSWYPELARLGLRVAYVAQDGQPWTALPLGQMACLFIGGSTAYKESDEALALARACALHGVRVHVGRVNSERRLRLFDGLGVHPDGYPMQVDSIDGTQFSMFPDRYIPRWAERLQPSLRGQLVTAPAPLPMFEEEPHAAT